MDITGFPKDCRKMLVAFVTQQRITVERKIRKDNAANSLYSSFSLPNRLMIGTGKHSNKKVANLEYLHDDSHDCHRDIRPIL